MKSRAVHLSGPFRRARQLQKFRSRSHGPCFSDKPGSVEQQDAAIRRSTCSSTSSDGGALRRMTAGPTTCLASRPQTYPPFPVWDRPQKRREIVKASAIIVVSRPTVSRRLATLAEQRLRYILRRLRPLLAGEMMNSSTGMLVFAGAALVMALTPGPNLVYLISRTLCQGRRASVPPSPSRGSAWRWRPGWASPRPAPVHRHRAVAQHCPAVRTAFAHRPHTRRAGWSCGGTGRIEGARGGTGGTAGCGGPS